MSNYKKGDFVKLQSNIFSDNVSVCRITGKSTSGDDLYNLISVDTNKRLLRVPSFLWEKVDNIELDE